MDSSPSQPPPHAAHIFIVGGGELATHLGLFEGMWAQFAVANVAMGTRNIGQAPTHMAMPSVTSTSPRYIGLRV